MDASQIESREAFRAEVSACRARLHGLLADAEFGSRARSIDRIEALYDAALNAARCGARTGHPSLAPLVSSMEDVWSPLRTCGGLGSSRVRSLLVRTVSLLEVLASEEACLSFADTLCAGFVAAARDAAWEEHARGLSLVGGGYGALLRRDRDPSSIRPARTEP